MKPSSTLPTHVLTRHEFGFSHPIRSFEWRQQLVNDIDSTPVVNQKQQQISKREEAVKEKIILSQEKNIFRLNELVRSLRQQLLLCRCNNETTNGISGPFTEHVIEVEREQILED
ncbi:hypothetical protein P3X46_000012 [Hevea brasiliensis]|uniref:Uncharacterized protein n=1 Tax=Hevea brasiliensis TaxID=3981 RepID=A0ABQ9N7Y0_HEVBR|nr:hypothetical protein P3X46_000012 [Hevea brasiliensis]